MVVEKRGNQSVTCQICNKNFRMITNTHLVTHNITIDEYKVLFPDHPIVCEEILKNVSDRSSGENNYRYRERKIKLCPICGTEFESIPGASFERQFCSSICSNKNNSIRYEKRREEVVVKECELCGNEFEDSIIGYSKKFCSRECVQKYNSLMKLGDENPMKDPKVARKNGDSKIGRLVSEEDRRRMSAGHQGISYDEWKSFATGQEYCPKFDETCRESNRDKYDRRCFLCDKSESENVTLNSLRKRLAVHHVDMNKNQGCDGIRWKLIPLCMKCHNPSHTKIWESRIEYLLNNVWM